MTKEVVTSEDVLEIITILEEADIDVWLDGGWAVDALAGKQTRQHEDLDVVVDLHKVDVIRQILQETGFEVTDGELPARLAMQDTRGREIDLHTVTFDVEGGGVQKLQNDRSYRYPPEGFNGTGEVDGRKVKCLTAEVQAECHYVVSAR